MFVVLLVIDPTSHELGSPANPVRFKALNERPFVLDPEDVARGGAFISLAGNGELKIERGFVRPEDEPVIEAEDGDGVEQDGDNGENTATAVGSGVTVNGSPVGVEDPDEDDGKIRPLSERLIEDLTAARRRSCWSRLCRASGRASRSSWTRASCS
ncbi:MAG: hypothetical protein LCH99_33425 [Proteobacteria bacterium]|nr:hypothetical protein [Pseudomonadota bacterium]